MNFRSGPGADYPPLSVLNLSTVVRITGQVANNNWWQGQINNLTGWLNVNFITLLGNCYNLPAVQPPPSPITTVTLVPTVDQTTLMPGRADLIVANLLGPAANVLDRMPSTLIRLSLLFAVS
jgi:hypothetical protein